jgi:hypothetical protein
MNELAILERLAWYQIGVGNLIATLSMGGTLLRSHPEIAEEIDIALSGRPL